MDIKSPLCITSRLMAGHRFEDGSSISIDLSQRAGDNGRIRYKYFVDADGKEYEADDLQSGLSKIGSQHGLQQGLESIVYFLLTEGILIDEELNFDGTEKEDRDEDAFPIWVVEWAHEHLDELEELEEILQNQTLIS